MKYKISIFAILTISTILIGSFSNSFMVIADEKYSNYNQEPTKHPKYDPNSNYDNNIISDYTYHNFLNDDDIFVDSKRHHPRAFEDMAKNNDVGN